MLAFIAHADPKEDCSNEFGLAGAADGSYQSGNFAAALHFYSLLKGCGYDYGFIGIGRLYEDGAGVTLDYKAAAENYSVAARNGHPYAALLLARMYATGKGVLQNFVTAHILANLAAKDGYGSDIAEEGSELVQALSEKMVPTQIARAQEAATSCKQKNKFTYKNCGF